MSHYSSFYRTFLQEMPQRVPGNNDFAAQLEMLQENLQYDSDNVISIAPMIFKIEIDNQTTYWGGDKDAATVTIIVDTETTGKYCKIILSSKNPALIGNAPYASDLYSIISKDVLPQNLIFTSDNVISSDAERLWKRLIAQGKKVSVYDSNLHQYILTPVNTEQELINYIGGPEKNRFVFVLSESSEKQRGMIHTFNLMEIKRLANWPLFDHLISTKKGLQ